MSDATQQVAADLEFVKQAVERREREGRSRLSPRWLGVMWGMIVLAGCTWNDLSPQTCWVFWAIVPPLAWGTSSALLGKQAFITGEYDAATGRRMGLHWSTCFFAGMPVVLLALARRIDWYTMGQLLILISGIVYYLGGVHFDRRWIAPGLVMMVGAAALTYVHRGIWTAVGAATCVALVAGFWREPGRTVEAAA